MTITKRITSEPLTVKTARVDSSAVNPAIYDAWGDSWGTPGDGAWGDAWVVFQELTAIGASRRVDGAPAANVTKRVTS